MTDNLLTLNFSITEFLLIGFHQQLDKVHNCSLSTTDSARNLGFIFYSHLIFSDQISALSKSCYYHIREFRCIRPYLDSKAASTIASSTVHSKLDYCNSIYYNLPKYQINPLHVIQNSLVRAVVKAPKFSHATPIVKSLHGLKSANTLNTNLISLVEELHNLKIQSSFLICCHPLSTTYILFSKNHQSVILLRVTSSLESTSCLIPSTVYKSIC